MIHFVIGNIYIHQKLTEKLTESDSTLCHQPGGINNISPIKKIIKTLINYFEFNTISDISDKKH